MANLPTHLPLITSSQGGTETRVNERFDAASNAIAFGVDGSRVSGLHLALFGGNALLAGARTFVPDYEVDLAPSVTSYIQLNDDASWTVTPTSAPVGWPDALADDAYAIVEAITGASTITGWTDRRVNLVAGGSQTITLTGDVTGSGTGSFAATIAANVVTLAKMAQVATARFLGRTTASTGNVEALTGMQATAMLDNVVGDAGAGGTKGLVPAPGSGDAAAGKYLKADGTFAVPPGGGGAVSSVANSDTTLTISPTTGSVVASLNLAHSNTWTKAQGVTPAALTDGANIAVDASLSNNFTVTLGGNRTLDNPTNLVGGFIYNFYIEQDGTGTRTLAYGSKYKFPGGFKTISTAASSKDLISCLYDATDDVLLCTLARAFS